MAEQMNELQLMFQEKQNTGTTWTRNEKFDKDGYLVVKDLWDAEELYHPLPELRGQLNYWDKNVENFNHTEVEQQVEGSLARYWHPQYRQIHTGVRLKLEETMTRIANELSPTRLLRPLPTAALRRLTSLEFAH